MMSLYEVTNGFCGQSYVRCYVWADGEAAALELSLERFRGESSEKPDPRMDAKAVERWQENLEVTLLFSADAQAFSTFPSDEGFELTDWRDAPGG